MPVEHELTFRIILEKPPAGVDFALQKGKGNNYETVQKQRSGARDLRFDFTARAVPGAKGRRSESSRPLRPGSFQCAIRLSRYRHRCRSIRFKLE